MSLLLWAGLLLLVGLALLAIEFFVPSGGLLGLLAVVALLASVAVAFRYDPWAGAGVFVLCLVLVPFSLSWMLRWWPRTATGRRLLLDTPRSEEVLPDSQLRRQIKSLIGKQGVAKSLMTLSGAVEVEGMVIDAVSEALPIEAGQSVRVVEVRGARVVVRPVSLEADQGQPEAGSGQGRAGQKSDDPLSQSIETLGLDPFEDPLA